MAEESQIQDASGNLSIDEAASRAIDEATESTPTEVDNADPEPSRETSAATSSTTTDSKEEVIDWTKLPPNARKAYEDTKKSYDSYRSLADRKFTEYKKLESDYEAAKQKATWFDNLDQKYRTDPNAKQLFDQIYGKKSNIDPALEADPLTKYFRDYQTQLDQRLAPLFDYVQTQQQTAQKNELNSKVEALTKAAVDEFKNLLGREPTQEEHGQLYQSMADKQIYDGHAAVRSTFMEQIIGAKVQAALNEQMAKKSKTTKTSNISASRSIPNGEIRSYDQAIEQAMTDLGMQF